MLFFFNDTATTEIYTLSLHDALPIYIQKLANEMVAEGLIRFVANPAHRRSQLIETTPKIGRAHV